MLNLIFRMIFRMFYDVQNVTNQSCIPNGSKYKNQRNRLKVTHVLNTGRIQPATNAEVAIFGCPNSVDRVVSIW